MILISKVFRRLFNLSDAIFRQETSTVPQRKSRKRIQRKVLIIGCLFTFDWRKYFFAYGRGPNVFRFRFKSAEWAGNFVVRSPKVGPRIISFRRPFGLPVWNFGRPRVNCGRLWRPLGSSLVIIVVFLLRPFTSKREIKIEPDLRLTLEQDSSWVKLISKSGFLNNLLFRGWLVEQFLRQL